jgi:glycosyltransferase involved in cell wall biosynthesis
MGADLNRHFIFLSSSFPRGSKDSAGRFVFDLGEALSARGHRVDQLAPLAPGLGSRETFGDRHRLERFPWPAVPTTRGLVYGEGIGPNLRRGPHRLLALPGLWWGMKRALQIAIEGSPDSSPVVVSHWALPAGLIAARLRRERPKLVHLAVAHGGGAQLLASWPGGRGRLRAWLRGTDGLLCVSRDLLRKIETARGRIAMPSHRVSAMGLDLQRFRVADSAADTRMREDCLARRSGARFLVAGVGRLIPLKGFDLLIDALASRDDTVLAIAGAGPEAARLGRLAEARGVALRLLGPRSPDEVGNLLRAADLFAFPGRLGPRGRSEGAPMAVMEALACGTPVVAASVGGVPELLRAGIEGEILPPGDVPSLRATLGSLLENSVRRDRMAAAALEGAARFDRAATAEALEELLFDAEEKRGIVASGLGEVRSLE